MESKKQIVLQANRLIRIRNTRLLRPMCRVNILPGRICTFGSFLALGRQVCNCSYSPSVEALAGSLTDPNGLGQ